MSKQSWIVLASFAILLGLATLLGFASLISENDLGTFLTGSDQPVRLLRTEQTLGHIIAINVEQRSNRAGTHHNVNQLVIAIPNHRNLTSYCERCPAPKLGQSIPINIFYWDNGNVGLAINKEKYRMGWY